MPRQAEIIRLRCASRLLSALAPGTSRFAPSIVTAKQEVGALATALRNGQNEAKAERFRASEVITPKLEAVGSSRADIDAVRREEIRRGTHRKVL